MNYITKQLLIEIDENEINKVKIGNLTKDVKRDAITNLSIGLSVLIGVLTMPLIDYLNFSMIAVGKKAWFCVAIFMICCP